MLMPKGGVSWKAAQSKIPSSRSLTSFLFRTRTLVTLAIATSIILLWRSVSQSAADMQRFYCFGPNKAPMDMTLNEQTDWHGLKTPVLFNHHEPIVVNDSTIIHKDLNAIKSTSDALKNEERVLILTPLRDASPYLNKYFELLSQLTYPHNLIDLAFLVGDSGDTTMSDLVSELERIQRREDQVPFRSVKIIEKDFGSQLSQDVEDRHGFEAQGPRRKAIARARNYLLYSALEPEHSWVYWRDVDIQDSPKPIIEHMIEHDTDVIVPNIWFHRYENGHDIEGRFDYNSWQESEKGLKLAASLDKDAILLEGYKEYDTGRRYMATMGDWRHNKDDEIELDGIGGVNIMVKADVHRSGINFPCYAFENQAETEGFAKMAKRAKYRVVGLPNYVVWHTDTQEKEGNLGEFKDRAKVQE